MFYVSTSNRLNNSYKNKIVPTREARSSLYGTYIREQENVILGRKVSNCRERVNEGVFACKAKTSSLGGLRSNPSVASERQNEILFFLRVAFSFRDIGTI